MRKRALALLSLFTASVSFSFADRDDVVERVRNAHEVLHEILNIPDGIPSDLLDKAECAIIIPSVKKFALGFGGSYGKGVMLCRQGADYLGPWGSPACYRLEGGSIGFQIGGSATDYVLLVMNTKGVRSLLGSKVKLGADATAAGGPKGRSTEAATDAAMAAEILSYSRSKGLFAGVSLKGSTLRQDSGDNEDLYRQRISAKEIIHGNVAAPAEAKPLIGLLQKVSPKNKSN